MGKPPKHRVPNSRITEKGTKRLFPVHEKKDGDHGHAKDGELKEGDHGGDKKKDADH